MGDDSLVGRIRFWLKVLALQVVCDECEIPLLLVNWTCHTDRIFYEGAGDKYPGKNVQHFYCEHCWEKTFPKL